MATPKEFRMMMDAIEDKYGPDVQILIHGPESVSDEGKRRKWYGPDAPNFSSGFGPAANYIASETHQANGKKILLIMVHGCPIKEQDGPTGFPIYTSEIPLFWQPFPPTKRPRPGTHL